VRPLQLSLAFVDDEIPTSTPDPFAALFAVPFEWDTTARTQPTPRRRTTVVVPETRTP
jgi:hypothetical protein